MNVITVWINDEWTREQATTFVDDLATWLAEDGYGTGRDEALRSVVTATEVPMAQLSQEEFVSLVAGGQAIVVVPRSEGQEHEAFLPPEEEERPAMSDEEQALIEREVEHDYARGFADGHAAGMSEGYDKGYGEGWDAASAAAANLDEMDQA